MDTLSLHHHGAVNGVTGSCHELRLGGDFGVLVDCGLFQGAETAGAGRESGDLRIDFPIEHIKALVVTHVHIDHVGRIPYLLAAGFKGPILCSQPSAHLLPLVLEDAVQLGFTRDPDLVLRFLALLKQRIIALPYQHWFTLLDVPDRKVRLRLQPAGHILGSAYVECDVQVQKHGQESVPEQTPVQARAQTRRVVFSGDLGATYSPLLPAPKSPYRCDTLVIESTYGDRRHPDRRTRRALLKAVVEKALADQGVVLIPAFSIGRTQEILYEIEAIIAQEKRRAAAKKPQDAGKQGDKAPAGGGKRQAVDWQALGIIVDSPLASRFTESYRYLKPFWDKEALNVLRSGRDPLDFEQLITVGSHHEHEAMVRHLKQTNRACVVIAASGMCAGGRIVNYLKALIEEPRTDIVLVG
ncbi:MAG TPA: MBL fold metallo-hydrolase, partial [Hyphomicrobiales bacterium]|nr:MBL fold metallo-hydrolase [Hyphomicrobiales bacterium]